MFTLEQIETAHRNVATGADFPKYIQEISAMGVRSFETWVMDSHTNYFGDSSFQIQSPPLYDQLLITDHSHKEAFIDFLKRRQEGETDYFTFCKHCAETGIEKWVVDLENMTCIYYDRDANQILLEEIPKL
ncbi:MAG: DUF1398 family protein [Bacteroidetes bacterium]|nr:DUF1398 family protein [Bacteroidota bacterium]